MKSRILFVLIALKMRTKRILRNISGRHIVGKLDYRETDIYMHTHRYNDRIAAHLQKLSDILKGVFAQDLR